MSTLKTIEELDETVSAKLIRLSQKYPQFCIDYLVEMHKVLDWAEKQLKVLTKKS